MINNVSTHIYACRTIYCYSSSEKEIFNFSIKKKLDIKKYEALGIELFKLSGREFPTRRLLRGIESYSQRKHEGNLADILALYFLPTELLEPRTEKEVLPPPIYIDNQKLDGFLAFFEKIGDKCDQICHRCSYCSEVAEKVVTLGRSEAEAYLKELESLHSGYLQSFCLDSARVGPLIGSS